MKQPLLDLHGFKIEDVDAAVDRFLSLHTQKGTSRIRIMTGKGTGKIKKRVIDYLKLGHFPWEYEKLANGERNEGVLVVILE